MPTSALRQFPILGALLLAFGCAHAIPLDGPAVEAMAGCYVLRFDPWTVNRDSVDVPKGDRVFRLTLDRAATPRDSGSPEPYLAEQLRGPSFGDEVPPDALTWNVIRRQGGGFAMTNFNGLYGIYFHVVPTDSGLVGPARITSDYHIRGKDGQISGSVASATVRATRVSCRH